MRRIGTAGALVLLTLAPSVAPAASPGAAVVRVDLEHFEIAVDGNAVVGVRRAPVPYDSLALLAAAVIDARPVAAAVRVVRSAPPQVIDYVFCVTEDGALVIGQQLRTVDTASDRYVFTEGGIKRAYPALEATVPWTWLVDIPLGREAAVTLEIRATAVGWPVRAVSVTPRLVR